MTAMTREGPGRYVAEVAGVPVHVYRVADGWGLGVGDLDSGWSWRTKQEVVAEIPRYVEAYVRTGHPQKWGRRPQEWSPR